MEVFHEYPKARYRDGVYTAVADAEEESAAAANGWTDWHSDQARMNDSDGEIDSSTEQPQADAPKRRGRPPKAKQPA